MRDTHDARPPRAVATLMALVLGGLGVSTLTDIRAAGPALVLDGSPAMWMGGLYLALAGMPLSLWFRTPRATELWTVACGIALVTCLAMAIRALG